MGVARATPFVLFQKVFFKKNKNKNKNLNFILLLVFNFYLGI